MDKIHPKTARSLQRHYHEHGNHGHSHPRPPRRRPTRTPHPARSVSKKLVYPIPVTLNRLPLPPSDKKSTSFIATITHPVFFQSGASRHIDIGDHPTTGRFHVSHSVNIQRYLDVPPAQGEALHQQPVPQVCFLESLLVLL